MAQEFLVRLFPEDCGEEHVEEKESDAGRKGKNSGVPEVNRKAKECHRLRLFAEDIPHPRTVWINFLGSPVDLSRSREILASTTFV